MAIILLENNKTLVYVPDCPLPDDLMEPEEELPEEEIEEEETTKGINNYSSYQQQRGVKRERDVPQEPEKEKTGIWAKGLELKSGNTKKQPFKKQRGF